MGVANQIPLRASNFGPGAVLRQISNLPRSRPYHSSATSSLLRYTHTPAATIPSPFRRQYSGRRLVSVHKNHYSTKTAPLLSPEKPNNNGRKQSESGQSQKKVIKYAVIGGVVVVLAVAFSDKVQHAYRAAARSGRVAGALAVCINE